MRQVFPTDTDRAWRRGKNGAVGGREESDPDPDTGREATASLLLLLLVLLPVAAALYPGGGTASETRARRRPHLQWYRSTTTHPAPRTSALEVEEEAAAAEVGRLLR